VPQAPADRIVLLAARLGRWRESAQLMGAYDAWAAALGTTRGPTELLVLRLTEEALDSDAGRERQLELRTLGAGLPEDEVHALALTILALPEPPEPNAAP
jgi:hypothetical protein